MSSYFGDHSKVSIRPDTSVTQWLAQPAQRTLLPLPGQCAQRLCTSDRRRGNALGRQCQCDFIRRSRKTFTPSTLYSSALAGARRHYFYVNVGNGVDSSRRKSKKNRPCVVFREN